MEDDPVIAEKLLDYARSLWDSLIIEDLHRLYETAVPVKTWEVEEYAEIWHAKYIKHCEWRKLNLDKQNEVR